MESSLLPVEGPLARRITSYVSQFFQFCFFLPLSFHSSLIWFACKQICVSQAPLLVAFAKKPVWDPVFRGAPPVDIGFATADFQDQGPFHHPHSNWGRFYQNRIEKLSDLGMVPDIWNHPERVIDRLAELGCKKFRFSVSRDLVEPRKGEAVDEVALQHYRQFCRELKSHGIEPMVTLHHFTDPVYFSWERKEDISGLVQYAKIVSEALYEEGVRKIITINEPTVVAFQGWVMGEFPPHKTLDFATAGVVLENMMRAHTQIYEELKKEHPDFEIGLSHDPIRFRYFHRLHPLWSPIERLICHYLTEMSHGALFRFLKEGAFSLQVPLMANHTFSFPQKPPLDFIGLQYYTDPLLKLSMTGGASVSRIAKEKITSYQYRTYPQGLASAIHECHELNIPIELTEIGIDTGINWDSSDTERIVYYDRIFQVVQRALDYGIPVRSLYFWTLIDNLEWYKAWAVRFGFYSFDPKSGQIDARPSAIWLREKMKESLF